jgi:ubiquitin-like protein ATG12
MPERIVVVRFKAVGNAPIMKQNFYKITASNRFQAVIQFLRKELAWKAGDPLVSPLTVSSITASKMMSPARQFTYINLAFSPAPDDTVSNLYKVCDTLSSVVPDIDFYLVFCHRWTSDSKL